MRFRIDLKIFIFLILFYFTKQIELYAFIMIFALIHELGHLLAGILLGMKPEKLELMPFGVSISFKINVEEYNKKIKKGNILEIKKMIVAAFRTNHKFYNNFDNMQFEFGNSKKSYNYIYKFSNYDI